MNQGLWFASPKKMLLTFLNCFSISVGLILVFWFPAVLKDEIFADFLSSVVSACIPLGDQSTTTIQAMGVSHARIIPKSLPSENISLHI